MIEVDLPIPPRRAAGTVPGRVERACAAEGLTRTLKSTLAKYPGCIHWHFKKGKERGTLEITWWGRERRLWFKISAGRNGDWMAACVRRLKERMFRASTEPG